MPSLWCRAGTGPTDHPPCFRPEDLSTAEVVCAAEYDTCQRCAHRRCLSAVLPLAFVSKNPCLSRVHLKRATTGPAGLAAGETVILLTTPLHPY